MYYETICTTIEIKGPDYRRTHTSIGYEYNRMLEKRSLLLIQSQRLLQIILRWQQGRVRRCIAIQYPLNDDHYLSCEQQALARHGLNHLLMSIESWKIAHTLNWIGELWTKK